MATSCPCQRQSQTSQRGSSTNRTSSIHPSTNNDDSKPLCVECMKEFLRIPLERQREALEERNKKREWCGKRLMELRNERRLLWKDRQIEVEEGGDQSAIDAETAIDEEGPTSSSSNDLFELKQQSLQLQHRLSHLRQLLQHNTHTLTQLQLSNETREATLLELKPILDSAHTSLVKLYPLRELQSAISGNIHQISLMRFHLALQLFDAHKMDLEVPKTSSKIPTGIGKIGGLVLPHAGPALYGALPPNVLSSALRLVASLTSTVARCLGIRLPHPILLRVPGTNNDDDDDDITKDAILQTTKPTPYHPSSSLFKKRFQKRSSSSNQTPQNEFSIGKQIRHASFAVIRESPLQTTTNSSSSFLAEYELRPPHWEKTLLEDEMKRDEEEQFAIGLQLLQNDVVALCIRAGVDVEKLWPAEAVLLNLYELLLFSRGRVECGSGAGVGE